MAVDKLAILTWAPTSHGLGWRCGLVRVALGADLTPRAHEDLIAERVQELADREGSKRHLGLSLTSQLTCRVRSFRQCRGATRWASASSRGVGHEASIANLELLADNLADCRAYLLEIKQRRGLLISAKERIDRR